MVAGELNRGLGQALVLVLAVDVDEVFAQAPQHLQGHRRVVDECPGPAVGAHHPAHQATAGAFRVQECLLVQQSP